MRPDALEYYWNRIEAMQRLLRQADDLRQKAIDIERTTERELCIWYANREPGFPCVAIKGLPGYFNTPYEAISAALEWQKENFVGEGI